MQFKPIEINQQSMMPYQVQHSSVLHLKCFTAH